MTGPTRGLPEAPSEDEAFDRARLAMCWLLTIPGAPLIYMGDEYGEHGGRDPDNRHAWRGDKQLTGREAGLLAAVRKLGIARKATPILRRGDYLSLGATETLLPFFRTANGEASVLVVLNADSKAAKYDVNGFTTAPPVEIGGLGAEVSVNLGVVSVTVPARSRAIVR